MEKEVTNTTVFMYLLVSILSLVQLLAIETIFYSILFDFAFENFTQGPWYQISYVLLCFLCMVVKLSVKKKNYLFLFCGKKIANTASLAID